MDFPIWLSIANTSCNKFTFQEIIKHSFQIVSYQFSPPRHGYKEGDLPVVVGFGISERKHVEDSSSWGSGGLGFIVLKV